MHELPFYMDLIVGLYFENVAKQYCIVGRQKTKIRNFCLTLWSPKQFEIIVV